jgi:DNA mismatch repair protein MutS2
MAFFPGDSVHVKAIGKGTVREVRNGGRYLVDVKGRSIQTSEDQLTSIVSGPQRQTKSVVRGPQPATSAGASQSIDLHGHTVDEAVEALGAFLNAALLAGSAEVRVIHGRSGGKIKAAVHAQLRRIATVRRFNVDPGNPGVTIVVL